MLCADRRCVVACVITLGIAVGGVAQSASGWFQASGQGDAVAQAKGQAALAEARRHLADNRWRLAIEAYESALTYLPANAEALAGVRTAQAELKHLFGPGYSRTSVGLRQARRQRQAKIVITQSARRKLADNDDGCAEQAYHQQDRQIHPLCSGVFQVWLGSFEFQMNGCLFTVGFRRHLSDPSVA